MPNCSTCRGSKGMFKISRKATTRMQESIDQVEMCASVEVPRRQTFQANCLEKHICSFMNWLATRFVSCKLDLNPCQTKTLQCRWSGQILFGPFRPCSDPFGMVLRPFRGSEDSHWDNWLTMWISLGPHQTLFRVQVPLSLIKSSSGPQDLKRSVAVCSQKCGSERFEICNSLAVSTVSLWPKAFDEMRHPSTRSPQWCPFWPIRTAGLGLGLFSCWLKTKQRGSGAGDPHQNAHFEHNQMQVVTSTCSDIAHDDHPSDISFDNALCLMNWHELSKTKIPQFDTSLTNIMQWLAVHPSWLSRWLFQKNWQFGETWQFSVLPHLELPQVSLHVDIMQSKQNFALGWKQCLLKCCKKEKMSTFWLTQMKLKLMFHWGLNKCAECFNSWPRSPQIFVVTPEENDCCGRFCILVPSGMMVAKHSG